VAGKKELVEGWRGKESGGRWVGGGQTKGKQAQEIIWQADEKEEIHLIKFISNHVRVQCRSNTKPG
jgi:hypothetical protein